MPIGKGRDESCRVEKVLAVRGNQGEQWNWSWSSLYVKPRNKDFGLQVRVSDCQDISFLRRKVT